MKKAILATKVGMTQIFDENGVLIPVDTPHGAAEVAAFSDALLRVAKMEFGDIRAAALEKFSFERMIERTKAAYLEHK